MCMSRQPMLPEATGRERMVVEALDGGNKQQVLATLRWATTYGGAGAPDLIS